MIKGQNLRIKLDGKYIAASTNASINLTADTEEVTTKDDGTQDGLLWKKQEAVLASWDLSADAVYVVDEEETGITADAAMDLIGKEVTVVFEQVNGAHNRDTVAEIRSGKAIVTSVNISAQNRSNGTFSIQAQGNGPLESATESE